VVDQGVAPFPPHALIIVPVGTHTGASHASADKRQGGSQ
jgi:hypothetical protein